MRTVPELDYREMSSSSARIYQRSRLTRNPCRFAAILTLSVGAMLLTVGCEKKEEAPKPGPPEVGVVEPLQQNVPQLNGPVNAEITPKVQGYLLRQNYQNGYFVKKRELLFELVPRQ